jgi:hypothetical protein
MNTSKEPSAIGVYDDLEKAQHAIDELRQAGFVSEEIGIIGHVGAERVPMPPEMNAPEENATTGVVSGGILGAIVGAFVILVIPGLGEVAGLGPWFDAVAGAALGAAVCGILVAFGSFLFWQPKTRFYVAELDKGNFIVTVKNPARKNEAAAVLRHDGAHVGQDAR